MGARYIFSKRKEIIFSHSHNAQQFFTYHQFRERDDQSKVNTDVRKILTLLIWTFRIIRWIFICDKSGEIRVSNIAL